MKPSRGFTLIEITIVLGLIALLLTIAVPRYFKSIDNGKLSVQRQNLAAIRDALDKYYGDQGKYPDELDDLVKKKYLRAIPVDPVTQLPNWTIVAPEDATQGQVYDVRSAMQQAEAPTAGAGSGASSVQGADRTGSSVAASEARVVSPPPAEPPRSAAPEQGVAGGR